MTSENVGRRDAKASLSELTDVAAGGEDIVISKHGRSAARLTQVLPPRQSVERGRCAALAVAAAHGARVVSLDKTLVAAAVALGVYANSV